MSGKKIIVFFLVAIMIMTTLLAGCGSQNVSNDVPKGTEESSSGSNSEGESTADEDTPKMDEKQYLNLLGYEPKILDSGRSSTDTSWDAFGPIIQGLTRVEGTTEGIDNIKPGMAKKWEHNEDGTEWTFYLRDAKWSDGVPVTAHDFEFSIKRLLNPETGSPYSWLLLPVIKGADEFNSGKAGPEAVGVKAIDEKTLKFELVGPTPYFLQLTYFPVLKPIREDIIEKYGEAYGTEADKIVCNGPFILEEWQHRSKLVYKKNPDYWDAENVYIEEMVWHHMEETNARMQALLIGDIDSARVVEKEWKEKFDATGDFNYISKKGADVGYHMFNCKDKYFKNAKVRKAFSAAIDRDAYVRDITKGTALPGWFYVPDSLMIGEENYQDKVGNPQYVKKLFDEVKDPKTLLIEGLKELGEDPDPAKMEVSMMFRGTDENTKKTGEWYQQQFKEKLGVNLKIDLLKYNIAYDKQEKDEYQIFDTGWFADYNDPSNFLDFWHSQEGYYNIGWQNEEFDNIIKEAQATLDNERRAELFKRAEEILVYEDCIIAPYDHGQTSTYRRKYVKELYNPLFGQQDFIGVYISGRK
ncbi:peptide ABC transporter substrate-binding protein [Brassicibacter mesophilus]|uniref:peptide ABC transporter substrate-binding protein n=1 Tax=Brassicibacter mesophilus TaxID=745119 RepID=UPI003D1BAF13